MEIKGTCEGAELDKRTYLPGLAITDRCPECGADYERDLGDLYLSYPVVGVPMVLTAYCDGCDHEWPLGKFVLRVTLEAVKEP